MYGCVVFLIIAYRFMNKIHEQSLFEILKADQSVYNRFIGNRLKVLFWLEFFYVMLIGAGMIVFFVRTNESNSLIMIHAALNLVLYIFIPFAICILLGTVLSMYLSSKYAYCIILIMWFGITSVSATISMMLMSDGINLYSFLNILKISAPDLGYEVNRSYGVPMEYFQWSLRLSWIFTLGGLIFLKFEKKMKGILSFVIVLIFLPAIFFSGSRIQQENFVKSGAAEWENYENSASEVYQKESRQSEAVKNPEYQVSKYNIELDMSRGLSAKVSMEISNPQPNMIFTLFEGYKITGVKNTWGEQVQYSQTGHYIEVKEKNAVLLRRLTFYYTGCSQKFYSSSQGVYLPGYFPYYPLSGQQELVVYEEADLKDGYCSFSSFHTDVADRPEVEFSVSVKGSALPVFTNLKETERNVWRGKAKTVSIISGLLKETDISDICIVGSITNQHLDDCVSKLNEELEEIEHEYGINTDHDFQMVFCIDPMINYMSGTAESTVDLGDHVILSEGGDYDWGLNLLFNPITNDGDKEMLKEILLQRIRYGFEETEKKVMYEAMETDDMDSGLMDYLLNYKVTLYGKKQVVSQIYSYLKDEDTTENPQVFLKKI